MWQCLYHLLIFGNKEIFYNTCENDQIIKEKQLHLHNSTFSLSYDDVTRQSY